MLLLSFNLLLFMSKNEEECQSEKEETNSFKSEDSTNSDEF